jgi:hypothetical protein
MRIGRYVLAFALLIGALIVFGNRGLVDNYVSRERLQSLKKVNQEIDRENRELKRQPIYCGQILRISRWSLAMTSKWLRRGI